MYGSILFCQQEVRIDDLEADVAFDISLSPCKTMVSTIEHFLARFHLADDVDTVFTNGCCYWFAVILHCRFPDSTLMYDQVENHFVTQIQGRLYDITGDVTEKYQVKPWDALDDELLKKRIVRDCILF